MSEPVRAWSPAFIERYTRDLYHCSNCNYCVDSVWPERGIAHVCVTMEQHTRAPGYSGRGFIEAARAVAEGMVIDADALSKRVYTCTTCGNCETVCPIGLRPAAIGRAMRAELVAQDRVPVAIEALRAEVLSEGNPYAQPRTARTAWSDGLVADAQSAALLFAGCAAGVACPDEARAAFNVMRRAGLTPALPAADHHCCGAPLAELGFDDAGATLARDLEARLGHGDRRQIVAAGCECQHHLAILTGLDVTSFAAWLKSAQAEGRLDIRIAPHTPQPLRVRALESCQLKRRARAGAAADEHAVAGWLRGLGVELLNGAFPAPHALCCGAAGGMPRMQPQAAARMADARLAVSPDAITLSLDPRCAAHLRASAPAGARVYGLAEFVDRYCDVTPAA